MNQVIITEKPSVARELAKQLGNFTKEDFYLRSDNQLISWTFGHLFRLPQPHEINLHWKRWRLDELPLQPQKWPLHIIKEHWQHYQKLYSLLKQKDVKEIISATDAGREGELIFRYLYHYAQCKKPVRRLWLSSLTESAIKKAWQALKPANEFDSLASSALARAKADWLIGMNFSRTYSLLYQDQLSVGRVQTPSLAFIVENDEEISQFANKTYYQIKITLEKNEYFSEKNECFFLAAYSQEELSEKKKSSSSWPKTAKKLSNKKEAEAILLECQNKKLCLYKEEINLKKTPPPLLFDLTSLQQEMFKLYGLKASKTLQVAQSLYEKKLITYPRTDSCSITQDLLKPLYETAYKLFAQDRRFFHLQASSWKLSKAHIQAENVSDHHAILPTGQKKDLSCPNEKALLNLVNLRLIETGLPSSCEEERFIYLVEKVESKNKAPSKFYLLKEKKITKPAWKLAKNKDLIAEKNIERSANLTKQQWTIARAQLLEKETLPPRRMSEASLLAKMKKPYFEKNKDIPVVALGTSATRAAIIDSLYEKDLIQAKNKKLYPTEKAKRFIALIHPELKSARTTSLWEKDLESIRKKKLSSEEFLEKINFFIKNLLEKIIPQDPLKQNFSYLQRFTQEDSCVDDQEKLARVMKLHWNFDSFRTMQKEVCQSLLQKKSCLVLMPTGAGKSLCYQLPGLVLSGACLVISPLLALMEDQALSLRQIGLKAECLHSAQSYEKNQDSLYRYLKGELDFLFIAPERLVHKEFVEKLEQVPISLIAIDEAHCILEWGQDFRPDYENLRDRLPFKQNPPLVALTATADSTMQKAILKNLKIKNGKIFVSSLARKNIAIEIVPCSKEKLEEKLLFFLSDKNNLPALIYTPSRKSCDELGQKLGRKGLLTLCYHAGLSPETRAHNQNQFFHSNHKIMVATIAFAMGIDKKNIRSVIHCFLPPSFTSYYQQIGRAGRDGLAAKALLLLAENETKRLLYLLEKTYPPYEVLKNCEDELSNDLEVLERFQFFKEKAKYCKKENFLSPKWQSSYLEHKIKLQKNIEEISQFAYQKTNCRMQSLCKALGAKKEDLEVCSLCDYCCPEKSLFIKSSFLNEKEKKQAQAVIKILEQQKHTLGQLSQKIKKNLRLDRNELEPLLTQLYCSGLIDLEIKSFYKNQHLIFFKSFSLSKPAREKKGAKESRFFIKLEEKNLFFTEEKSLDESKDLKLQTKKTSYPKRVEILKIKRKKIAQESGKKASEILSNQKLYELAAKNPHNLQEAFNSMEKNLST